MLFRSRGPLLKHMLGQAVQGIGVEEQGCIQKVLETLSKEIGHQAAKEVVIVGVKDHVTFEFAVDSLYNCSQNLNQNDFKRDLFAIKLQEVIDYANSKELKDEIDSTPDVNMLLNGNFSEYEKRFVIQFCSKGDETKTHIGFKVHANMCRPNMKKYMHNTGIILDLQKKCEFFVSPQTSKPKSKNEVIGRLHLYKVGEVFFKIFNNKPYTIHTF